MMNPKQLRQLTEQAIRRGRDEAAIDAQYNAKLTEMEREKERLRAAHILEELPFKAEKAARAGQTSVKVMRFEDRGENRTNDGSQLSGAEKLVFDGCVAAGFDTTIVWQHDGAGYESWFEIHVAWK